MSSHGTAGGSLEDAGFASSAEAARVGRAGEIAVGRTLDAIAAKTGITVLHDLRIPGAKANIDHVVVSGNRVWLIDTKVWQPGTYLTVFGRTFRGLTRVLHADKRGLPLAQSRIRDYLNERGCDARLQRPLLVVRSSKPSQPVHLWGYRPASDAGARVRPIKETQRHFGFVGDATQALPDAADSLGCQLGDFSDERGFQSQRICDGTLHVAIDATVWQAPADVLQRCAAGGLAAEGIFQIECTLRDGLGEPARDEKPVTVAVEGGDLLGLENGDLSDNTPYSARQRRTLDG